MTLIELENGFKIRFDHNEVRISIDGDIIDVGAKRREEDEIDDTYDIFCKYIKSRQRRLDQK